MKGRVLIVAGSDSGGGAGIQADIKAVTCLGGYAATAITALTAQNTEGVFAIHEVPPDFIARQMQVVLADIGADCIKIGMLHSAQVIEAVAAVLEKEGAGIPVVLDPVMTAKGGQALLDPAAMDSLRRKLLQHAALLTPNIPEALALTGLAVRDRDGMAAAARSLSTLGPAAILLKGGHLDGPLVLDLLLADGQPEFFSSPRIATVHTHGTGCTLASAIATGLAQKIPLREATLRARAYLYEAIKRAPGLGRGHGPVDHGHTVVGF